MSNYDEVDTNYYMLERRLPVKTISMLALKCNQNDHKTNYQVKQTDFSPITTDGNTTKNSYTSVLIKTNQHLFWRSDGVYLDTGEQRCWQ